MKSNLNLSKVPPQATDLEVTLLGAIIYEPYKCDDVLDIITTSEVFYKTEHQIIYDAILEMSRKGSAIDLMTITDYLRSKNKLEEIGGAYYLLQIVQSVVSSAHASNHARILIEKWINRSAITISQELTSSCYNDEDAFDNVDKALISLSNLRDGNGNDITHVATTVSDSLKDIHAAINNPSTLLGIRSGLQNLDDLTNGFQKGQLIILAARPSQGKSSLVLNFPINSKAKTLFFSLEMSKDELIKRAISSESGIPLSALQHGTNVDTQRLNEGASNIAALPLYLDDRGGLNVLSIKSRARKIKRLFGLELIIIDYLQLIKSVVSNKGRSRENEVGEISRDLKALAKELNVPIIALAQLSRDTANKKPELHHLRESGSIEQDADVVMMIYHDEVDGETKSQIIVNKNRNGRCGEVAVKFNKEIQYWKDESANDFNSFKGFQQPKVYTPENIF